MTELGSCGIVFNSGALLRQSFGSEIDSLDFVLRVNLGPTATFEANVGSKTSAVGTYSELLGPQRLPEFQELLTGKYGS